MVYSNWIMLQGIIGHVKIFGGCVRAWRRLVARIGLWSNSAINEKEGLVLLSSLLLLQLWLCFP